MIINVSCPNSKKEKKKKEKKAKEVSYIKVFATGCFVSVVVFVFAVAAVVRFLWWLLFCG